MTKCGKSAFASNPISGRECFGHKDKKNSGILPGICLLQQCRTGSSDFTRVPRFHLINVALKCCGIPVVCPADLAQGLDVFLTDLSRQTALSALLLIPLALWEHMWGAGAHKINAHTRSFSQYCTELHLGV